LLFIPKFATDWRWQLGRAQIVGVEGPQVRAFLAQLLLRAANARGRQVSGSRHDPIFSCLIIAATTLAAAGSAK
jgi:hypothetical protein